MVGIGHNGAPKQSVFRNAKKGDKYTVILNSCLQDERLSYDARGLLTSLMSHPNDWVIKAQSLIRQGCKKDKLYKLIEELITFGYMGRHVVRNEKNQIAGHNYWVSDKPFPEIPEVGHIEAEKLLPEKQEAVKPEEEKSSIKSKGKKKEKVIPKKATSGKARSGISESSIKKNKLILETNKKTSKKDFARKSYSESFEKFYQAYPKHTTKAESFKSWKNLSKADQAWATGSIPAYKKLLSDDGGWRKPLDPVRYLNRRMFEDFQIADTNAKRWGWWRSDDRWGLLTPEDWRCMIRAHKPNGVWPWQELGPPPNHPECLLPIEAQNAYGDKYSDQVEELIREHGESVQ